jgi:glycosyltransferase involved in cell wall biosynthesis
MFAILKFMTRKVSHIVFNMVKHKAIIGYDEFLTEGPPRRALVSYLVHPVLLPPAFRDKAQFSNRGIAQQILRALNELGYIVDVIDYQNRSWSPTRNYDLFVGHGGVNFQHLASGLSENTVRIYFSTGIYWRELNIRAARVLYDLAIRRGYLLPPERFVRDDEEYANRHADGIVCLGNTEAAKTYAQFQNVIPINNAAYPIVWNNWSSKDFDTGRQHFLFFSGRGNLHRGLDLLLEAFTGTDLQLHICQHIEPEFAEVYHYELNDCPNIHLHGFVKMRSPQFEALIERCTWVILPTCAEGQPGSVIECMAYGLIPVLTDEANIDLEDWGIRLPERNVESIRSVALQASRLEPVECEQRAAQVVKAVQDFYSVDRFRTNFKQALVDIVASKANGCST